MSASKGKRGVFSKKKKRTRSDGESSISDIWSQLHEDVASNLRRSVVSLVLNARGFRFPFSGIAIECQNNVTKFVTTGKLVSVLQTCDYEEEIEVYYEGNVATGYLDEYDSDCQLAVVKVLSPLNVYCIHLNPGMESVPCKQLIAVGRVYDEFIATSGEISRGSKDREFLIFSRSPENSLGAAFFDIDGNFVGMNHCYFLPRRIFLERSTSRGVFRYVGMNGWYETKRGELYFHPKAYDVVDKEQFQDLNSLGYPIPSRTMVNRGMILVNTCEDPFGDLYPKGVWGVFRKRVSSEISRNVVALASFKGETRFFACTGVFIDYDDEYPKILTSASLIRDRNDPNKIVEDLRVGIGGPLVDVDGNFIGMNFHGMCYNCEKIGTPYMDYEDLCRILECLKTKKTTEFSFGDTVRGDEEPINEWPVPDPYWFDPSDVEEDDMNDKQEVVADGCPKCVLK
ncbi:hypothetical protein SETIT_2G120900v2 [Setaria italica]|uniref:Uncharacterized protein n=1 Tax=Setaria italica TaxID=4555 RepID=A0A368PY65_SETIT|nr:hypothetical protein SETIT_2G120900v2 [Setaria italica]